jgi:hypothetical protein
MQATFHQFIDKIRVETLRTFNENGSIHPTWFLQEEDGQILLVATPYTDDLTKDMVDFAIREAIRIKHIQRYAYISEVWMAFQKDLTSLEDYKGLRPSQRPDRKEALMFIAEDISGDYIMSYSDIYRDSKTDLAMIAEIKIDGKEVDPDTLKGRFVKMFKGRKKPSGSPH